jgi:hypothetical protein
MKRKIQKPLNQLSENLSNKKERNNNLKRTFGKVKFQNAKSPLEILKELRDEWD